MRKQKQMTVANLSCISTAMSQQPYGRVSETQAHLEQIFSQYSV